MGTGRGEKDRLSNERQKGAFDLLRGVNKANSVTYI